MFKYRTRAQNIADIVRVIENIKYFKNAHSIDKYYYYKFTNTQQVKTINKINQKKCNKRFNWITVVDII